jgi:hypothetical protein
VCFVCCLCAEQVGVDISARYDLALKLPEGPLTVHKNMSSAVLVLKLVPGFDNQSVMDICSRVNKNTS